jgi:hypothetical protein
MDETPRLEAKTKEIPRWAQLLAGLALGTFTILCGFASLSLLLAPPKESPFIGTILGLILLFGCLWVLEKCLRLLTGRKNQGGLMAPKTLRRISWAFLVLPLVGLFTGYYWKMGPIAIKQAMLYFFTFFTLRALARRRLAEEVESKHSVPTSHDKPARRPEDTI